MDSKNIPKIMQQSNCCPEYHMVTKWPKNQNFIQCILFPQFCSPTIPKRGLHQLDCISFEQERVREISELLFSSHLTISDIQNPPLPLNVLLASLGVLGNGIPIPVCWKTCNTYAISRFLNQVILTELPMGKKETVRKVCNMADHKEFNLDKKLKCCVHSKSRLNKNDSLMHWMPEETRLFLLLMQLKNPQFWKSKLIHPSVVTTCTKLEFFYFFFTGDQSLQPGEERHKGREVQDYLGPGLSLYHE